MRVHRCGHCKALTPAYRAAAVILAKAGCGKASAFTVRAANVGYHPNMVTRINWMFCLFR